MRLFNSVNSSWSQSKPENDNYAKKLFKGGTTANPVPLTSSIISSVPLPFQRADAFNFFKSHLSEARLRRYFEDLVNDPSAEFDFDSVCGMCTNIFNDFIEHGEPLSKSFEQYYEEAFADKDGFDSSNVEVSENDFIFEAKNHCPLCSKRDGNLTYFYKGKPMRNFRIAKIYPDVLPAGEERDFRFYDIYRPDQEDPMNKIALCKTHYQQYSTAPDFETYKALLQAKKEMVYSRDFMEKAQKLDLSKIEEIIIALNESTPSLDGEDLSLAAKNVKDKIQPEDKPENYLLYEDIMHFVRTSYKTINSYLADYEFKSDGSTELGRKIKKLSSELMSRGKGEKFVFNKLVELLQSYLPDNEDNKFYCSYIVAYFIAHCEVLTQNEIAE